MENLNDYNVLLKICESRKSIRTFDTKPVPTDILDKIRKVAFTSPYASGRKNWDILVVTEKAILEKMHEAVEVKAKELSVRIRPDMKEYFTAYNKSFVFFSSAPALFVLTYRIAPTLSMTLDNKTEDVFQWERDNYVKSISCVAMLTLLAAESLGLGGCYVTGALIAENELARLLNIPRGISIGALIPIGFKTKA